MGNCERNVELNNLEFPPEFFQDEVREGFYISTMMKRYWASQLKVLSIIARICDMHGLKWFADCGSLLGAVRHGGYVPWDDDLDICMLRADWLKLFDVLEKELPAGYKVLAISKELEYNETIGRVVNCDGIDYSKIHLDEFYGCPYIVGIDIFPLDGIYDDKRKEEERRNRAKEALEELNSFRASEESADLQKKKYIIERIDQIYSECPTDEASKVALMPFYMTQNDHVYKKELFEHVLKLPFENTYIYAPARYDEVLKIEYGDFMHVVKGGGIHKYPVYAALEQILKQNLGRNPFRYTMDMNELLASVSRYVVRTMGQKQIPEKRVAVFLPCKASWWKTMEPLWKKYTSDENMEVHVLPIFYFDCDHNGIIGEKHDERDLFPDYVKVEPCEEFDFGRIHPDIIVTQVPYDGYNTAFTVHEFFYSSNLLKFTDELVYVPCFDMDPPIDEKDKAATAISVFIEQEGVVNADRVVLNNSVLRQLYIDKLVELSSEDTRKYWEQKIVVIKDECDSIASLGFNGNPHQDIDQTSGKDRMDNHCKRILYYVSISPLMRYKSAAIEKIMECFDIFEESKDKLEVIFVPQDNLIENLRDFDEQLYQKFAELLESIERRKNITHNLKEDYMLHLDKVDAYYGDASPYARKCVGMGIPVMIQNYEIRKEE